VDGLAAVRSALFTELSRSQLGATSSPSSSTLRIHSTRTRSRTRSTLWTSYITRNCSISTTRSKTNTRWSWCSNSQWNFVSDSLVLLLPSAAVLMRFGCVLWTCGRSTQLVTENVDRRQILRKGCNLLYVKRTIRTTFTFKQLLNVCFIFVGRRNIYFSCFSGEWVQKCRRMH